ncbi:hypothetical protein [Loktanella sp. S4079]|uniref:hypothetical protein n=1 Tax=Loktanella sp. S4079 TaxID=579483 RepID=UPI0005F9C3E3|nr:hypothetical protein [Loktanella sp. S4079]KJZ20394.1 hypothetical protein TW80_06220 [Loktanella sp. S4079]
MRLLNKGQSIARLTVGLDFAVNPQDMLRTVLIVLVTLIFAACGGGGGGGDETEPEPQPADPRIARLAAYGTLQSHILGDDGEAGMDVSPASAVPDSGTMNFSGFATLRAETSGAHLVLYGDAVLSVDFATGTADGSMDQFFGTSPEGAIVDYDGVLSMTGRSDEGSLTLDYDGALSHSSHALELEGTMTGDFVGDPVGGIVAADYDAGLNYDGQTTGGTLIVIAEAAD